MAKDRSRVNPDSFGGRLDQIMDDKGLNLKELAEKLSLSQSYLSDLRSGKREVNERIIKLVSLVFHVNDRWLEHGTGEPRMATSATHTVAIPVVKRLPEGFPDDCDDAMAGFLSLPSVTELRRDMFACRIEGDAMNPVIRDGDFVLFTAGAHIRPGDIVVARDKCGKPVIRKYWWREGQVLLLAEHPEYRQIELRSDKEIIGKVIKTVRETTINA